MKLFSEHPCILSETRIKSSGMKLEIWECKGQAINCCLCAAHFSPRFDDITNLQQNFTYFAFFINELIQNTVQECPAQWPTIFFFSVTWSQMLVASADCTLLEHSLVGDALVDVLVDMYVGQIELDWICYFTQKGAITLSRLRMVFIGTPPTSCI